MYWAWTQDNETMKIWDKNMGKSIWSTNVHTAGPRDPGSPITPVLPLPPCTWIKQTADEQRPNNTYIKIYKNIGRTVFLLFEHGLRIDIVLLFLYILLVPLFQRFLCILVLGTGKSQTEYQMQKKNICKYFIHNYVPWAYNLEQN